LLKNKGVSFYGLIGVLLVFVAVAGYAYYLQFTEGLIVTGLRDVVTWGLYITNYSFFIGLSAGALIISAVAYTFDLERYKQISKMGVLIAIICGLLAIAFIMVDLGNPARAVVRMILNPSLESPFVYDFFAISGYLLVCVIYGAMLIRDKVNGFGIKVMASISLASAILVIGVSSWIFGFVGARPLWSTGLLTPLFITSALLSGIALVMFTAILTSRFTKIKIDSTLLSEIGKIVAVLIFVDLFLILSENVAAWYANVPSHIEASSLLLTGSYSLLFWTEIVVAALIPLVLLTYWKMRKSIPVLAVTAILVMAGTFVKKFNLIIPGLSIQDLGSLGETSAMAQIVGTYSATWIEWAIVAGLIAFGILLFTLGSTFFSLGMPTEKERKMFGPGKMLDGEKK